MAFEEAKKILEKEGFELDGPGKPHTVSEYFTEFEDPNIYESMQVVSSAGYSIIMLASRLEARKARLQKEYEKSTKAPGPGEDQSKEGNPALKEAASQFNDALLNEQAKEIEELTKEKTNLEDQITILNACKEYNENFGRKQIKRLGKEIAKLNSIIHDKNAVLADVSEELRLSKIREKNLAELGLKYVGENEKLKKELADKVVDKIDAQALKSAESALAWKEKVITEKDEVIADLGKELKATKTELEEKTKLVETVRKSSKEDRDYGIAAEKMIQKMAKDIVGEKPICSEDFEEYRRWANGYRFNPQLYDFIEKEEKKLNAAKMVDINAKCMRAARESINDVFESYAAKYAKSTLDELKDKAYETFNAKAHKLGLVGSKDGKGIPDQIIRVDIAEEGGDHSDVIVLCGTDFVKMLTENEDFIHDLFGKKHKEIKEFMSAEAEQLFEGDGIPTKMEVMKPSRKFKKIK